MCSIAFLCLGLFVAADAAAQPFSLLDAEEFLSKARRGDGRSREVEELLKRGLEIRRQFLGNDDPRVAEVIQRLGAVSYNRENYKEAEERFRQALDIYRMTQGERAIATAQVMGDVAAALREQGRCAEALPLVEQSLDLYRPLLRPDHPLMGARFLNLARVELCLRRTAAARADAQEALRIFQAERLGVNVSEARRLLDRIQAVEQAWRHPLIWAMRWGLGALAALSAAVFCTVWQERRGVVPTRAESATPPSTLRLFRIADVIATLGLYGCLGVAGIVIVEWLLQTEAPSLADSNGSGKGGGIGFVLGIWIATLASQIGTNLGRWSLGLPTVPLRWWPGVISDKRDYMAEGPLRRGASDSAPWFAAMDYGLFRLNRTYKLFVTDRLLCAAKVGGQTWSVSPAMRNPAYWVETKSAQLYAGLDVTSQMFLRVNEANFQIDWREVAAIDYRPQKKAGLAGTPHSGSLIFRSTKGETLELVLVGDQDGDALQAELDRIRTAQRSPAEAGAENSTPPGNSTTSKGQE